MVGRSGSHGRAARSSPMLRRQASISRSCTLFHCRSGWWVWPVCSSHVHWTTALSSSDVGVCALYSSSLGVVPAPPYQRSKRPYTFGDQSGL